ncbi:retrovirus-related Pol polyprotein from transposon 297 [Trichonephila clavipes]|nr:retrovirus-related Pol polyprotein from transposon 297 [Trichonephila clavipes]
MKNGTSGPKPMVRVVMLDGKNGIQISRGLPIFLYHEIDTDDNPPVASRPYRYDKVKQKMVDYYVNKMLEEGKIITIQSSYASLIVLCRKSNGLPPESPDAYRFVIDYRKLNVIVKCPLYPLPLTEDLITNIPHTRVTPTLDLRSEYFEVAVNPRDIPKTIFVTKSGTYTFTRIPFGLSGADLNFQKAIDIILKPLNEKISSALFKKFTFH